MRRRRDCKATKCFLGGVTATATKRFLGNACVMCVDFVERLLLLLDEQRGHVNQMIKTIPAKEGGDELKRQAA